MANDRTQASGRQAGASQGVLLLAASALPAMGVVLLSPIAVQLPNEIGPGPGGMDLTPIILTAPALAIAIFSSLAGYLLDKVGRRICFLIAMFVYAVLGTAPLWLENVYLIVMTRFGLGMTEAVIMTAAIALVGDYFSGSTRDRWVASMMAVTALAATLFYILGGVLGAVSWKAPFAAYGASFVLFLAALWLIFEPDTSYRAGADRNETVVDKHPRHFSFAMAAVLAATLVGSILFFIVPLQLGRFLAARGAESSATIGLLIALAGLGNPIGAYSFRYLRLIPFAWLMAGSAAISGFGLLLASMGTGITILIVGAFINQLGSGIICPLTMAAVLRLAPSHRRGTSGGGWNTAFFVGQFFSPLVVISLISLENGGDGLRTLALVNIIFAAVTYGIFSNSLSGPLRTKPDDEPAPLSATH